MKPSSLTKHPLYKEFFTTNDPPAHHEKRLVTRPYPQYYRIVLRSVDRDAGSLRVNAQFTQVTLPERFTTPAVLFVESFNVLDADSGATSELTYEIRLNGLTHPRSWDSSTHSATNLLAVVHGYDYYNQSPSLDAVGLPITDPNQFQHANLQINLQPVNSDTANNGDWLASDWTLVLAIVAIDDSIPI